MQEIVGRTLGHYRIVDKIGAGGMGVAHCTANRAGRK